jgi:hypothetical protein
MTVTLISASQSQVASAQAPTPLDVLRRRLTADAAAEPAPVQAPSPRDAAALLKLFDVQTDQPAKTSASASRAAGGAPGKGARIIDPMSLASMPAALQAEANAGPLWPQVSRCWRPTGSNARVSMLIKLEPSGQLADPPIIFRSGGQPTPDVTAAEKAATRAVWACAPYTIRAATSTAYNLVFRDGAPG